MKLYLVTALLALAPFAPAAAREPAPLTAQGQCVQPFWPSKAQCEQRNKKCAQSRSRPGCWSPVEAFKVPAATTHTAPVIFKMPPNATARIERAEGKVCALDQLVCGGAAGVDRAECDNWTNECICGRQCSNAGFLALMRDDCVPVGPGDFATGDGRHVFFLNNDCNPANNQGAFQVVVSY